MPSAPRAAAAGEAATLGCPRTPTPAAVATRRVSGPFAAPLFRLRLPRAPSGPAGPCTFHHCRSAPRLARPPPPSPRPPNRRPHRRDRWRARPALPSWVPLAPLRPAEVGSAPSAPSAAAPRTRNALPFHARIGACLSLSRYLSLLSTALSLSVPVLSKCPSALPPRSD